MDGWHGGREIEPGCEWWNPTLSMTGYSATMLSCWIASEGQVELGHWRMQKLSKATVEIEHDLGHIHMQDLR